MNVRAEEYAERAERFETEAQRVERRARLVSNLRGSSFGVFAIAGLMGLFGGGGAIAFSLSIFGLGCFIGLVMVHDRVLLAEHRARARARVNRDALARVTGAWHSLDDGSDLAPAAHPYAADLDLFGRGSLFQRASVAHTPYGRRTFANWLIEHHSVGVISRRQEAARALCRELELRQRLEVDALGVAEPRGAASVKDANPEHFVAWAEGTPALRPRTGLVVASRLLPLLTALLVVGAALGVLPTAMWALGVALQGLLLTRVGGATAHTFGAVSATEGALSRYAPLFQILEELEIDAELTRELRERLAAPARRPSVSMRRFQRIVSWFELRHNGLIHPFVNILTLWDVHCVLALEGWQEQSGKEVRGWLTAVGEFEALCCFAGLAYDEPSWCFPEVTDTPVHFAADRLAHPLIASERRVANDVSITEPGRALLITGSNMSGKSTLLRSMGLAAVMAQAGGPVAAGRLRLARCRVRTSLRIKDSLEQGVSHFYAEVARLKEALEATEARPPVLFLLDEILHGTNSEERQIGARWVLGRLLDAGAIGVVTTHDEKLCRLEGRLGQNVEQFHFEEHVAHGEMTFDYQLRPGPVRGGNALRVMRLLGIDVPIPGEPSDVAPPVPT